MEPTRVMTLGALAPPSLEPNWTTDFLNPPPTTPQQPQNLLRANFQNMVKLSNLGRVMKGFGQAESDLPPLPNNDMMKVHEPAVTAQVAVPWALLSGISMVASTWHGYRRNRTVGWALWWGLMGAMFPIITPTIGLAQGWGKRV